MAFTTTVRVLLPLLKSEHHKKLVPLANRNNKGQSVCWALQLRSTNSGTSMDGTVATFHSRLRFTTCNVCMIRHAVQQCNADRTVPNGLSRPSDGIHMSCNQVVRATSQYAVWQCPACTFHQDRVFSYRHKDTQSPMS